MSNEILTIKEKLKANSLSSVWLINRLAEHDVITEKSELSAILAGCRRGPKVDRVVTAATEILDYYEKAFSKVF